MTRCEMCWDNPASVFTPRFALCKPCHRELELLVREDNPIPNGPTCADCGQLLNGHDTCLGCYETALHVFVNGMASVG